MADKVVWKWTMTKPQVPLAQGLHAIGIPLMQKTFEIDVDVPIKHVDGDIYFGKKEIEHIFEHIQEKINAKPTYPQQIHEKIMKTCKELLIVTKKLKSVNPTELTDKELLNTFFTGYESIGHVSAFMSFKGTIQMSDVLEKEIRTMISQRISGADEMENTLLLISLPEKPSFMTQAYRELLHIAATERYDKLEQYSNTFGWMGCIMYTGTPFTADHYRKKLSKREDAQKELKKLESNRKNRLKEFSNKLNKLDLNPKEKSLLTQFQTWQYLRTYVKDLTSIGMEPTLPLLREIAKRTNLQYQDVLYLDYEELKNVFIDTSLRQTSKQRQPWWGCVIIDAKITYYDKNSLDAIREEEKVIPTGLKGMPACQGLVQGTARIVKNIVDLDNVKEGDILITHMTTPNFVPTLAKVSAIVTDEGGITCHAAIISRELQIPCIIGTEVGTKTFRDGDQIEVDATKGTVKKIRSHHG